MVEVVAQWVAIHDQGSTQPYARQLAALEGLQIYAPLGQGLGLRNLCAQLEDRCFQVHKLLRRVEACQCRFMLMETVWTPANVEKPAVVTVIRSWNKGFF